MSGFAQVLNYLLIFYQGNALDLADRIIALRDGELEDVGTLRNALESDAVQLPRNDDTAETAQEPPASSSHTASPASLAPDDHRRQRGDPSVYKFYFANSGYAFLIGNMIFVVAWMFFTEFSTIWLKWWCEDNAINPNKHIGLYTGVYAMFGLLGTICACISGYLVLIRMVSQSAERLHLHLLEAVLKAPFWFLS